MMHYREGGGLGSADAVKCFPPKIGLDAPQTLLDLMEDLCLCGSVSCCWDLPPAEPPLAASSPVLVTACHLQGIGPVWLTASPTLQLCQDSSVCFWVCSLFIVFSIQRCRKSWKPSNRCPGKSLLKFPVCASL